MFESFLLGGHVRRLCVQLYRVFCELPRLVEEANFLPPPSIGTIVIPNKGKGHTLNLQSNISLAIST
eukprot:scaffold13478_cov132-Cylindrotheca_fusiformis.AAC.33